jgi:MFS family permease
LSTGGYEERRSPNRLLTLAIASIASVVAAIFTSEVWGGGTVGTAAVTPVIATLVTDLLSARLRGRGEPGDPAEPEPPARRRRLGLGAILAAIVIGLVAFLIAAVALTVPEVIADKSITGESGHTTYFGNNDDKPWGEARSWSDCFDDIEQCITDIVEANR